MGNQVTWNKRCAKRLQKPLSLPRWSFQPFVLVVSTGTAFPPLSITSLHIGFRGLSQLGVRFLHTVSSFMCRDVICFPLVKQLLNFGFWDFSYSRTCQFCKIDLNIDLELEIIQVSHSCRFKIKPLGLEEFTNGVCNLLRAITVQPLYLQQSVLSHDSVGHNARNLRQFHVLRGRPQFPGTEILLKPRFPFLLCCLDRLLQYQKSMPCLMRYLVTVPPTLFSVESICLEYFLTRSVSWSIKPSAFLNRFVFRSPYFSQTLITNFSSFLFSMSSPESFETALLILSMLLTGSSISGRSEFW